MVHADVGDDDLHAGRGEDLRLSKGHAASAAGDKRNFSGQLPHVAVPRWSSARMEMSVDIDDGIGDLPPFNLGKLCTARLP
jgi:hypothetical protein